MAAGETVGLDVRHSRITASRGRDSALFRRLRRQQQAKGLPCWLCGQDIRYDLKWPDPQSFSLDHARPLSEFPELAEDPENFRSSHLSCNIGRGTRDHTPTLGATSRDW